MANLTQLLLMVKNNNPQFLVEQYINQNYPNNPQMQELLKMGKENNIQGLEELAKKILNQQGKDFNTEMNQLLQLIKS